MRCVSSIGVIGSKADGAGSLAFAPNCSSKEERMSNLFLSRITLRDEPSVATLGTILFDTSGRHRSEASRRLVWTLFADRTDRRRDFLWREDGAGCFYVLSSRPPQDKHQLFTVETKGFEPALSTGDKLVFSLRANATVSRPRGDINRAGKRDDVVMAALKAIPSGGRAEARKELIRHEGLCLVATSKSGGRFRLQ